MNETLKYEMLLAMRKYGGGFVKALAEAWSHAEADNSARLERAFPEYVEHYMALAGRDNQIAIQDGPDHGS